MFKKFILTGPFTEEDAALLMEAVRYCEKKQPDKAFMFEFETVEEQTVEQAKQFILDRFRLKACLSRLKYLNSMDLKTLSTGRLLNIFRQVRQSILTRDWDRTPNYEADEEEERFFDNLKAELDRREHVTRRPRKQAANPKRKSIL